MQSQQNYDEDGNGKGNDDNDIIMEDVTDCDNANDGDVVGATKTLLIEQGDGGSLSTNGTIANGEKEEEKMTTATTKVNDPNHNMMDIETETETSTNCINGEISYRNIINREGSIKISTESVDRNITNAGAGAAVIFGEKEDDASKNKDGVRCNDRIGLDRERKDQQEDKHEEEWGNGDNRNKNNTENDTNNNNNSFLLRCNNIDDGKSSVQDKENERNNKDANICRSYNEPLIQNEGHIEQGNSDGNYDDDDASSKQDASSDDDDDDDDEFNFDMNEDTVDDGGTPQDKDATISVVREFDMDLLRDCITNSEEYLDRLDGKDVVLVVGKTGTGKSTFIQGIGGKTFTKVSFSCDDGKNNNNSSSSSSSSSSNSNSGITTAKNVFDVVKEETPVPGFDIGHAKVSMTKSIRLFVRGSESGIELDGSGSSGINTINDGRNKKIKLSNGNDSKNDGNYQTVEHKDQNQNKIGVGEKFTTATTATSSSSNDVSNVIKSKNSKKNSDYSNPVSYYIDTPGFADTTGEEIDIATSSVLNSVAKKCNTLRFVIIINYVSLLEDRGQSLRSTLKFMRKFVNDFDKNKKGFLFLFSHADEIRDVPLDDDTSSLDGARQALLKEIIRTIDGTDEKKDPDVIELLTFIKISLKQKFPFADIMHPLKTDFRSMTNFIEHKMKRIKIGNDNKNGSCCDLTGSSKLRLSGAIRKMLGDLRVLLNNSHVDTNTTIEIRKIQTTIEFLSRYIEFEEIRRAVSEYSDLTNDTVKQLRKIINREVKNGTTTVVSSEGSSFTKANVSDLKKALSKLRTIDSSFDLQTETNEITNKLKILQSTLFIDLADKDCINFFHSGYSQGLQKLLAWCDFSSDFLQLFYHPVIDHVGKTVKNVVGEVSKFLDSNVPITRLSSTSSSSGCELKRLLFNGNILKSVHEHISTGLSTFIVEQVSDASDVFKQFMQRLKSDIEVWNVKLSKNLKDLDFANRKRVDDIKDEIRSFQEVSKEIREVDIDDNLCALVGSIQTSMEEHILDRYEEAIFKSTHGYLELDSNQWSIRLAVLRDAMSNFSDLEGSHWIEMESSYNKLLDCTKLFLKTKSGELDEMSNTALNQGIVDGKREGDAINLFAQYQWFDKFLPPEECFVRNCTTKIRNEYFRSLEKCAKSTTTTLSSISNHILRNSLLSQDVEDLIIEETIQLRTLFLPEIVQCIKFGLSIADTEFSDRASQLLCNVRTHVRNRGSCWQKTLNMWIEAVSSDTEGDWMENITTRTENLNFAIHEMNEVIKMSCSDESTKKVAQSFKEDTAIAFSNIKEKVNKSLYKVMKYEECSFIYDQVQAFGEFTYTAPFLPKIESLKEVVRQRISNDIQNIEELIEQTSEFDKIDRLLQEIEQAATLFKFVSKEIRSRIRPLKRLRMNKEIEADSVVNDMIENNDYGGLGEFLRPLSTSRDQIQQLKFKKSIDKIYVSLDDVKEKTIITFRGRMTEEQGREILSSFKILEQARIEAGEFLSTDRRGNTFIEVWLKTLKTQLNSKFDLIISSLNSAIDRKDFVVIARTRNKLDIVTRHLEQRLTQESKKKNARSITNINNLKNSIQSKINNYVDTSFMESYGIIDTILSALKVTTEMDDPIFVDFSRLYSVNSAFLFSQVNSIIQAMKESVADAHCYDDAIVIIQNLMRSFTRLGDHLPHDFQDECKTFLERLIVDREKRESSLDFEGSSKKEKLIEWRQLLDSLDSSSPWWKRASQSATAWISGRTSSSTYVKIRDRLIDIIDESHRQGMRALRNRDFVTTSSSLEFLALASTIMGNNHVSIASSRLESMEKEATVAFLSLCKRSQDALQSTNCREFEPLFDDLREFILHITCLVKNLKAMKSYHLTNQLVYERMCKDVSLLEKLLDSFEFSATKKKVLDVRKFGGFVADRFSLLHEEIKGCSHIENDEWLKKLNEFISLHFQNGRDLQRIKFYAILGVLPSASKKDVKTAFKRISLTCHPDKCKDKSKLKEYNDKFLMIKNALDELEKNIPDMNRSSNPFDDEIRDIENKLRKVTETSLQEEHYENLKILLSKLQGMNALENLVKPKLDTEKVKNDVETMIKNHVKKVRLEVDSNWVQRNYQELNHNIKDLMLMEDNFKSYPNVFPCSWNDGIIKKVEFEIEQLGTDLRVFLQNKKMVNKTRNEFRRCFMRMGAVLVELPLFKDYTKKVMSDILESCLNSQWGYGFVFELGLSLQKGGETDDDDEIRIAQNLVGEFSHFKEVLTMVWNEETIQKPPEDTINNIKGQWLTGQNRKVSEVKLEPDTLLKLYYEFDSTYTSFLGEYLDEDADRNDLVQKIIYICKKLKPVSCENGFGNEVKHALPTIMAGVFALFTILKSGESYNRFEGSSSIIENGTKNDNVNAKSLLMKPHNIQVLTLLCMFGCGSSSSDSLQSQLLQIRTGEGKSMILGAAAAILGLLGFNARCVCYSEYLSNRDYELFRDIFDSFGLLESINYSIITTLSEQTTAKKGDIRGLTLDLMHGRLRSSRRQTSCNRKVDQTCSIEDDSMESDIVSHKRQDTVSTRRRKSSSKRKRSSKSLEKYQNQSTEEILLVDEVDVFFGAEFYGRKYPRVSLTNFELLYSYLYIYSALFILLTQFFFIVHISIETYNKVAQLKQPEIASILKRIWQSYMVGKKNLRLAEIKAMHEYASLKETFPGYSFLLDNEIALMLDQVRRVNDEPTYFKDPTADRIGYKVQDTVCYNVTFGYRTVFAYLKEADNGNLKDKDSTLSQVLTMQISCGQFSYANIKPTRILGVSGTLEVMSDYEKSVLQKYGVNQYLYIPSVYGESNFKFDKVGEGISIEKDADFFQKITEEISAFSKKRKRAVIVFFKDSKRLKEYTSSAFYRKLGRKKEVLTENKNANEKEFIISKASTLGQITICTAVFGRGTDFFCKDETLQKNGGVHVIQTFLSSDMSEEIQIQGRTARQGKKGSYSMILLDKDLENDFGIQCESNNNWTRKEYYSRLCDARAKSLEDKYTSVETNLSEAKEQDVATHQYFNALLDSNNQCANKLFEELYLKMKKTSVGEMNVDIAFAIDVTGSMTAYGQSIASTIQTLLTGPNSIRAKLGTSFPDTEFNLRVAVLGYRDIDDGRKQFVSTCFNGNSHFSESMNDVIRHVHALTASFSGGADLAEDHLGAIQHCVEWNSPGDWEGTIKVILLLTDAPAHGFAPKSLSKQNLDNHEVRHPRGLTVDSIVDKVLKKDIDLFVCSFSPFSTQPFEKSLSKVYNAHPSNVDGREIVTIPLVPKNAIQRATGGGVMGDSNKHNIFVLDESGSMQHHWSGLVSVYNKFMKIRRQRQHDSDLVSVVQFSSSSRVTCQLTNIVHAPSELQFHSGGTCFAPAASSASHLARQTPSSHTPVIIFMRDGCANDSQAAANQFASLDNIELHVIGFGHGTDTAQLLEIARSSKNSKVHTASNIDSLSKVFAQIATGGDDVVKALETEIGKRISDAVTERLSAEYM